MEQNDATRYPVFSVHNDDLIIGQSWLEHLNTSESVSTMLNMFEILK